MAWVFKCVAVMLYTCESGRGWRVKRYDGWLVAKGFSVSACRRAFSNSVAFPVIHCSNYFAITAGRGGGEVIVMAR